MNNFPATWCDLTTWAYGGLLLGEGGQRGGNEKYLSAAKTVISGK